MLLTGNENYEELKQSTKTFLQVITSDNLYYGLFLIVLLVVLIKAIDLFFYPFKKRGSMLMAFLKGCLKVFVMVTIGMRLISLVPLLQDFTSQILMSSSLIVVVLGFVFQEGLSNIVHGFILSVFRPFKLGDRVTISLDGQTITGNIESMAVRHTVIRNIVNSSLVIVPNSKMDMSIIQNNYFEGNQTSSSFLDVGITYESDLEHAIDVIRKTIEEHPYVAALQSTVKNPEPVMILVRDLADSAVCLRATVITRTVDENFIACSDIRRELVKLFQEDPLVDFAYPHLQVIPTPLSQTTAPREHGDVPARAAGNAVTTPSQEAAAPGGAPSRESAAGIHATAPADLQAPPKNDRQ